MRRINRGACPVNLDGPQSKGDKECLNAIAHFQGLKAGKVKANSKSKSKSKDAKEFKFRQYKAEPVKQQLALDYQQKCAYCESFIGHVTSEDIDHFRPKSAYIDDFGAEVKPGYYWLATRWDNLFPTCQFCNRLTTQTLASGGREVVGKGTHFPLLDESKRATGPGTEAAEHPLLLNPDQSDVENHLEFRDGGVVVPAIVGSNESAMGTQSIAIYGLQRAGLVYQREAYFKRVAATIVRYKRERRAYVASPNDHWVRVRLEEAMKEIREYLCCRQEYLTMTRQHVTRECQELVPLPGCTGASCMSR